MTEEKLYTSSEIKRKTIFAFTGFLLFLIGCITAWQWLQHQPKKAGVVQPLRSVLHVNELLFSSLFSNNNLSREYYKKLAVPFARVNGNYGLNDALDTSAYSLKLIRNNGDTIFISMNEIKRLPKTEITFDFKCIEGWNQISHWGGVKFIDFIKAYHLEEEAGLQFTGMETPDSKYYIGLDNKSMMHPQTLLCYELNNKPLPVKQGAPLRLIIPVKYGVKHLKRIGTIFFSNDRPRDYWYERGYDYYCGL